MSDDAAPKQPNGVVIDPNDHDLHDLTLLTLLNRFIAAIFSPSPNPSAPLPQRLKTALSDNIPLLRDASNNTAALLLQWTRRGTPLRALFLVSVSLFFTLLIPYVLDLLEINYIFQDNSFSVYCFCIKCRRLFTI